MARQETKSQEEDDEPEYQHHEEGPGKGTAGLLVEQPPRLPYPGKQIQRAAPGESLRIGRHRQVADLPAQLLASVLVQGGPQIDPHRSVFRPYALELRGHDLAQESARRFGLRPIVRE